jgi:hypothetical protein
VIASDIKNAVTAEKIEVVAAFAIVKIGPLGPGIHGIEPDDALHPDERGVEVLFVKRVVFPQACCDEGLEIERH